jgi:hypothetical protein
VCCVSVNVYQTGNLNKMSSLKDWHISARPPPPDHLPCGPKTFYHQNVSHAQNVTYFIETAMAKWCMAWCIPASTCSIYVSIHFMYNIS